MDRLMERLMDLIWPSPFPLQFAEDRQRELAEEEL